MTDTGKTESLAPRVAHDWEGKPRGMPRPTGTGWVRRATYHGELIEVWKRRRGDEFAIVYGLQITEGLDYARAAYELGRAIMHALNCDGELD